MTIIDYDRELMRGLIEAVEDGHECRSREFLECLIVEGSITLDMWRQPMAQLSDYLRTTKGQRALEAWARAEAIEEAMAV
jgi:hypothetical protein